MHEVEAISPVDGRYRNKAFSLSRFFSESALFKYRIIVEGEYLIMLSENPKVGLRQFSDNEKKLIRTLYNGEFKDILAIKKIEETTNHDVKAVEYFLKEKLKKTSLKDCLEWIHFALTSWDTDNISYALMLSESIRDVLLPEIEEVRETLNKFARKYKKTPMLARTHGQPASPTTMGKEFKVFEARLARQINELKKFKILAKLNGATGNYNAHYAACPNIDWIKFSKNFIAHLNKTRKVSLDVNLFTTQIEPHDNYAELFDSFRRINIILIDFSQDIWRYISDGWIKQKISENETGSSTMPHKVNPIDFENCEGNLGIANALFSFFSNKLPISRLQRDLSDSAVKRNFGAAFAHSLIAYKSLLKGLGKIEVNKEKILVELQNHPEVLAELLQVIFRKEGLQAPYEKMKSLTRGKEISKVDLDKFLDDQPISEKTKTYLKTFSPEKYIGLAEKLAEL